MSTADRHEPERRFDHVGRLRRELLRLDPWSFWIVSYEHHIRPADFAVVGTTGAFVIQANADEGYAVSAGRKVKIEGKPLGGLRELRRTAKEAATRLHDAAVFTDVEPVVCLTRAATGAPKTVSGVRVVAAPDLVRHLIERETTLGPTRAERGAAALGPVLRRGSHPAPAEGPDE